MTTEVLPQPRAITAVVFHDPAQRTLTVRPSELESSYSRLLWKEAWTALRRAEEGGWPPDAAAQWVWASLPGGGRQVVHGLPVDGGALSFHFPVGADTGYADLISRPGLTAIVTADTEARVFLGCRFFNRPV